MADLMGSAGLAWYQWRKHGRCSGLSPEDYFATVRAARARIRLPRSLERIGQGVRIDPEVIEGALLAANPELEDAAAVVVCRNRRFTELRLCLDRDLAPRPCGPDVGRDCPLPTVILDPPR